MIVEDFQFLGAFCLVDHPLRRFETGFKSGPSQGSDVFGLVGRDELLDQTELLWVIWINLCPEVIQNLGVESVPLLLLGICIPETFSTVSAALHLGGDQGDVLIGAGEGA